MLRFHLHLVFLCPSQSGALPWVLMHIGWWCERWGLPSCSAQLPEKPQTKHPTVCKENVGGQDAMNRFNHSLELTLKSICFSHKSDHLKQPWVFVWLWEFQDVWMKFLSAFCPFPTHGSAGRWYNPPMPASCPTYHMLHLFWRACHPWAVQKSGICTLKSMTWEKFRCG